MVSGISHITLVVRDLTATASFLERVFDAKPVYDSGDKPFSIAKEKFFLVGDVWFCIMEGEPLPSRTYNHIAFQIQEDELDEYTARVKAAGVDILPGRKRVPGEGRSLYFYDYDNHLFELHTGTLRQRLERYEEQN